MKSSILLLAFASIIISSCTSAYKTGQTPDDVYFSPERPVNEYVRAEKNNDRRYQGDDEYYEDRYLRMKVQNRTRWSDLDDHYYYSNRYNYRYNNIYFNNPWTPYHYWNYYYNPYNSGVIIINPKTTTTTAGPRRVNLNAYNNSQLLNSNYSNSKIQTTGNVNYSPTRNSNSRARGSDAGNALRDLFGNSNSSSNTRSSSNNNNSSTSNSSSSSSSSSSGTTTAPRRKF
jgi:hypothetical protein